MGNKNFSVWKSPVLSAFVEKVSHSSRITHESSPPCPPPPFPRDELEDFPGSAAPECHRTNQIKYETLTVSVPASSTFDTIYLTTFARWRTRDPKHPNPRFHPKSIGSSSQNPSAGNLKPSTLKPKPCTRPQFQGQNHFPSRTPYPIQLLGFFFFCSSLLSLQVLEGP